MIRKAALAFLLVLLGTPAWALSPSYSGGGGGEGVGQFVSPSVTAAGAAFNVSANELIVVPIFVEVTSGSAPAIVAVSNDVTPLAWRKRAAKTGTVGQSGGSGNCVGNFELWEAFSPAAITATHVTVTTASAADSVMWYANRYASTFGAARPNEGHTSLPVNITNNTGGITPTATITATSQADDLIVGHTAYCAGQLANSAGTGFTANNSFQATIASSNFNTMGSISKSVSATQSGLAVPFGAAPASPAGFFFIADALTNDAPLPKSQATSAAVTTNIVVTGGGGAPAIAAAAGFTTPVIQADFTVPGNFWSNTANYITNCGAAASTANSPSTWHFSHVYHFSSTALPCNDTTIISDPVFGGQTLQQRLLASEYSGTNSALHFPAVTGQGTTTSWLPNEFYTKIRFRTDHNTIYQNDPTTQGGLAIWSSTLFFGSYWSDIDFWEEFLPPSSNNWCGQVNEWTPIRYPSGTICGTVDMTQYHTIETLSTSDESTTLVLCTWLDGTFLDCGGGALIYGSGNNYLEKDRATFITLGLFNGQTPATFDMHYFITNFEIWSCSNVGPGTCPGTVVNHWPFP